MAPGSTDTGVDARPKPASLGSPATFSTPGTISQTSDERDSSQHSNVFAHRFDRSQEQLSPEGRESQSGQEQQPTWAVSWFL